MSNECDKHKAQILDYLGGHLNPDESSAISAHIEACGACRKMVDDMGVIPYLHLLNDERSEAGLVRALEAFRRAQPAQTDAAEGAPSSIQNIISRFQKMFELRTAVPIVAMAAAAMALFVLAVGGFPFLRTTTAPPARRLAQAPSMDEIMSAPWLPIPTDAEQAREAFRPYLQKNIIVGTLGGGSTETGATTGFLRNLFAVTTLAENAHILSTAVLVDRDRDLLISMYPAPDVVLLRSIDVEINTENRFYTEQNIYLNVSLSCSAYAIFSDDATGMSVLFAPGMNHMLTRLDDYSAAASMQALPDTVEGIAGAFVRPEEQADPDIPPAFLQYHAIEATRKEGEDRTVALKTTLPANFPERAPVFSADGAHFMGVLVKSTDQEHNVIAADTIEGILQNAASAIEEAHARYTIWHGDNRSFIESFEPGMLPQPVSETDTVKTVLHPLPGEGYLIAIDLDGDGAPDLAIHSDHPGILMRLPLPDNLPQENWAESLLSPAGQPE